MLEQPASEDTAQRGTKELTGGIDPHGGALATSRGHLAHQRRQRGFQQVEGGKEHHDADDQGHKAVAEEKEVQLAQHQHTDGAYQHTLHAPLLFTIDDEGNHGEKADHQRREVHPPVFFLGQTSMVGQGQRQDDETGHQHRM